MLPQYMPAIDNCKTTCSRSSSCMFASLSMLYVAGDNLLAFVKALANSPYLSEPGEYRHGSLVFFDVVGLFMVFYPARVGYIINAVVATFVFLGIFRKISGSASGPGFHGKVYAKHIAKAMVVNVVCWAITMVTVLCIGYAMSSVGQPMSWFTHNWLIVGLYVVPAIMVIIGVHSVAKKHLYQVSQFFFSFFF